MFQSRFACPELPSPTSSPAAVNEAGLGLERSGQRGLVILEGDVVSQEVGTREKLNLGAETGIGKSEGGQWSEPEKMGNRGRDLK